ncbi:hypothetical protein IHE61_13120 [Streptomyces sp. GKU 257-1]|nr:hypothetical protein [Streptomyces sp. GKU 257-1]
MHRSNGGADVTFTEWEEAKAHAAGDSRMRLNGYPAADHPGCGTGSALRRETALWRGRRRWASPNCAI